jgi:hypothetical protein
VTGDGDRSPRDLGKARRHDGPPMSALGAGRAAVNPIVPFEAEKPLSSVGTTL